MVKKYRVVFLGLLESEETFEYRMSGLGVSSKTIEQIIHSAPIILKGNMTLEDARRYADAVQHAGGRVNLQEHGLFQKQEGLDRSLDIEPLENFIMCPECGYKQLKSGTCVKCGQIFQEEKY